MFPGCTLADMRTRQQDLLREGGYEPVRRQVHAQWIIDRRRSLDQLFVQVIVSLLAAFGL